MAPKVRNSGLRCEMDRTDTKVSILVVEDEAVTLELLYQTLSRKYPQCRLYKALDGNRGLELFCAHLPDIVITDITMPGLNGVQMSGKMHRIKPDTKFIVLTGAMDESALEELGDTGVVFDHFIKKPISYHDLFDAVEKCYGEIGA